MNNDLIQVQNNEPLTTSLLIAEKFGKQHKNVIRKIEELISQIEDGSILSIPPLFRKSTYANPQNDQNYPMYYLNRDGFTLLAMSFTGSEALKWKLKYIAAFNDMEEKLRNGTRDNRLEIARLLIEAKPSRVKAIKGLYPEYFYPVADPNSLESAADHNTAYRQWIEDYGVTAEWISDFPTLEIFNNYIRYCMERRLPSMGKKAFYQTLEIDFNLTRRQKCDGQRYFLTA
jgi:Rha family phage regulatory protein